MSLFKGLGGKFYKVKGEKRVGYQNEKHDEEVRVRKLKAAEHSKKQAQGVANIIPVEVFNMLSGHHDYRNVRWGSRRVARVLNYCMAILDNERYREGGGIDEDSYEWAVQIVTWVSFLHLLPVKYQLKTDDVCAFVSPIILEAISMAESIKGAYFDDMEKNLIIDCAISSHELPAERHIILDVFHDACVLDNQMYDDVLHKELLRTEMAKAEPYQAWAKKVSMKNLQPSWVLYLQGIWGVDSLSNISKEEEKLYQEDVEGDTIM
tara:strand:- start:8 stop:799 length:792 start_codon:yes stop_codon:yes gene_type:complete